MQNSGIQDEAEQFYCCSGSKSEILSLTVFHIVNLWYSELTTKETNTLLFLNVFAMFCYIFLCELWGPCLGNSHSIAYRPGEIPKNIQQNITNEWMNNGVNCCITGHPAPHSRNTRRRNGNYVRYVRYADDVRSRNSVKTRPQKRTSYGATDGDNNSNLKILLKIETTDGKRGIRRRRRRRRIGHQ